MVALNCNTGGVKEIYIIKPADFVWNNGMIVRKKRKYGKFTRKNIKLTSIKKDNSSVILGTFKTL